MRKVVVIVAVLFSLALIVPIMAQAATDYGKMSTDQLYQLKKEGVPPQERANLDSEWMKRVVSMTPGERQKYQVPYSDQEIEKMRQQRMAPK